MLVRVRTPRIRIEGDEVPEGLIEYVKSHYAGVEIENDDNEIVDLEDTTWHRSISETMHGGVDLRVRRENAGMTQQEVADRIKTSRTAIAAMEAGTRTITHSMARRLSKLFPESSVNDFLKVAEEN